MATITKKDNGSWQVAIRKKGHKPIYRTFEKKKVAENWARDKEKEIEDGQFVDERDQKKHLISEAFLSYKEDRLSQFGEKTQREQGYVIDMLAKRFNDMKLDSFNEDYLFNYSKDRLKGSLIHPDTLEDMKPVKPDTLLKELNIISKIFEYAIEELKLPIKHNPMSAVRKRLNKGKYLSGSNVERVRSFSDEEYQRIKDYKPPRKSLCKFAVLFGIETGMRRTEICEMLIERIDWQNRVYDLEREKSDTLTQKKSRLGRLVPLTFRARAILRLVIYIRSKRGNDDGYVWDWREPDSLSGAARKLYKELGIENARLHDTRHDYGSSHADHGVDIRVTASAMGHVDLRSIKRYSHPNMSKAADIIATRKR